MTPEIAEVIYASLKETPNLTRAFLKLQETTMGNSPEDCQTYSMDKFIAVDEETKRILAARGKTQVVTPAEYDEEGNLTQEEVREEIPVTSEILTVETVFADFPVVEVEEVEEVI